MINSPMVEQRIRLGEDSFTEFKSVAREPLDLKVLAKEIVAFANAQGGQVFVGIEDDGTPTGVGNLEQADKLMLQIVQACQTRVNPAIYCSVAKVEVAGQLIMVIDVPSSSPDRPYRADHIFFVREANHVREASRDELVRMLQSQNVHYDETPVSGATQTDLDPKAMDELLKIAYEPRASTQPIQYLRALGCITPDGIPTVAGILLFGTNPEQWFRDARISAARFPGRNLSRNIADKQEITGTLLHQLDDAIAFLRHNVAMPSHVEGLERIEQGIPMEIFREALLNALTHRDYRAASQIRLFVFEDRIEIINPGVLLNKLTLDSIRIGGISQRRNPLIAAVLGRARRCESFGMGIPEMIQTMQAHHLPEPEFALEGGHFRLTLRMASTPSRSQQVLP